MYVLIGDDPELPGRTKIYVGEGDEVMKRIAYHDGDPERDFWDRVVLFVSKDQSLTKAHVRYLEARLVELARRARRCTVDNKTVPDGGVLPEPDTAEMNEFIEQVRLLLATLGVNAFEPASVPTVQPLEVGTQLPIFRYAGEGFQAECRLVEGEFVVARDSIARRTEAPSLSPSSRALRTELLTAGVLQETPQGLVFQQDYAFASPSAAAQLLSGANVNGRTAWRLQDGKTYKQWQEAQLPAGREPSPQ